MSRATLVLTSLAIRECAVDWCRRLPPGTRVEFKKPKRTLPQNDRFWAMLTDVSKQLLWHGKRLPPDSWRLVFLDALKREVQIVPNIDGTGFVNIGQSSSDLGKDEMSELMELIAAFGANHNVIFHDQESVSLAPSVDAAAKPEAEMPPVSTSGNLLVSA